MKRMLVVEDELLSQKVLIRLFKNDFKIDVCESADQFYQNCSNNNYDIIIMDIALRGSKNGLDLIREIKVMPIFAKTPILCLTAYAYAKDRKTAMDTGADLFVPKPVSNDVLKNAVQFLVNKNIT